MIDRRTQNLNRRKSLIVNADGIIGRDRQQDLRDDLQTMVSHCSGLKENDPAPDVLLNYVHRQAIHEAGHFIFHQLTEGLVLNKELAGGLNEGFADYMAATILNSPNIGNIMLSGKSIRSLENDEKYRSASQEVHELGNIFASG